MTFHEEVSFLFDAYASCVFFHNNSPFFYANKFRTGQPFDLFDQNPRRIYIGFKLTKR